MFHLHVEIRRLRTIVFINADNACGHCVSHVIISITLDVNFQLEVT